MRSISWTILASIFLVMLNYQNCETIEAETDTNREGFEEALMPEQSEDPFELATFSITDQNNISLNLEVNLTTGEALGKSQRFLQSEMVELKGQCLSNESLSELQEILNSAELCTYSKEIPADTMCTMAFISGYAELKRGDNQFPLGQYSNGCRAHTTDLCGSTRAAFVLFIEAFDSASDIGPCSE